MKSCHWALWFVKSYLISFANIAVFILRMFGEELKILCVTTERFRTVIGVLVVLLIIIITVSSSEIHSTDSSISQKTHQRIMRS